IARSTKAGTVMPRWCSGQRTAAIRSIGNGATASCGSSSTSRPARAGRSHRDLEDCKQTNRQGCAVPLWRLFARGRSEGATKKAVHVFSRLDLDDSPGFTMTTIVTKSEYARRKGVSKQRVSQWIRQRQISGAALVGVGDRQQIVVEIADAQLAETL